MAYVTALLPMAQGVQVYAALKLAAESARYTGGDERSTGQLMADTWSSAPRARSTRETYRSR